jgi:hypothetical protein
MGRGSIRTCQPFHPAQPGDGRSAAGPNARQRTALLSIDRNNTGGKSPSLSRRPHFYVVPIGLSCRLQPEGCEAALDSFRAQGEAKSSDDDVALAPVAAVVLACVGLRRWFTGVLRTGCGLAPPTIANPASSEVGQHWPETVQLKIRAASGTWVPTASEVPSSDTAASSRNTWG